MAISAAKIGSNNGLQLAHRLLSRTTHPASALTIRCSSHINHGLVYSSSLSTDNGSILCSSIQQHQHRKKSSMGNSSIISKSSSNKMLDAPTYSALRNNVTATFGDDNGRGQLNYVSPYSKFFNNIEAGRTSLGTTKALEQRVFEIQEQRLECGIPESELRFRTMSYGRFALPPYVSPGEHRVTVKVALSAIPFENEREKEIFLEIVGSRYNSKKGDLQLSSEKFASRIENKRYLVDMIEKIVLNARKLAKQFDTEDGNAKAANAN